MANDPRPELIERAAELLAAARHLVVFTGAGVSTESGLPDYRGPDGVWTRRDAGLPPPPSPFAARPSPLAGLGTQHPSRRLVAEESPWLEAEPNAAHRAIAELDRLGKLAFLVSQNVDDLHRKSGVPEAKLAELHGNPTKVRCVDCWAQYDKAFFRERVVADRAYIPRCEACGGEIRTAIVNFGDPLPSDVLEAARRHSVAADVYLVVGSTLLVTPAPDLPRDAVEAGAKLLIVNLGETPLDPLAEILIEGRAGSVLPAIVGKVRNILQADFI